MERQSSRVADNISSWFYFLRNLFMILLGEDPGLLSGCALLRGFTPRWVCGDGGGS